MAILKKAESFFRRARGPRTRRGRDDWNREYSEGAWDRLSDLDEMGRYWIAVGYCATKFDRPAVLDVGCGTGLMEEKLRLLPYSSYLGIDFSLPALVQLRRRLGQGQRLVCADLLSFAVREKFDVIAFMEVFESSTPAAQILIRYRDYLQPNGRMIVSLFDGADKTASAGFWKDLSETFRIEDMVQLENVPTKKSWKVALIAP